MIQACLAASPVFDSKGRGVGYHFSVCMVYDKSAYFKQLSTQLLAARTRSDSQENDVSEALDASDDEVSGVRSRH